MKKMYLNSSLTFKLREQEYTKMKKKEPSFSLYEFKEWISKQDEVKNFFENSNSEEILHEFVNKHAVPKVSKQKFEKKVETDDNLECIIDDFYEEGGTILEVENEKLFIEVNSGMFCIPRFCVKIKKD